MLESFTIKNFRLFTAIEVQRLARVNLLVGKNNSGKSAFLEAVELYASNVSSSVIGSLVESRQETWASEEQLQPRGSAGSSVRHLFHGHSLPALNGAGIVLGEAASSSKLHITVAAFKNEHEADGAVSRIRVTDIDPNEDLTDIDSALVVEENERARIVLWLEQELRRRFTPSYLERMAAEVKCPWQMVPTESMPSRKIAALWDLTSLTELEHDVISALRIIEPRVEGIAFVEDVNSRSRGRVPEERVPLVKLAGSKEPLPLKSMGDGMTRLFHIIVALVNAQNGILLVDEFENGLHWSIQPLIWDMVYRVAEALGVQVFATTHSRDCIAGFEQAWNKRRELGAFYRLDLQEGSVKAKEYTSEMLADSLDTSVEVR
jgi:predicted ATPase